MFKQLLLLVTLQISLAQDYVPPKGTKVMGEEGDYLVVCRQEPIDLGIVLDMSTSVSTTDFRKVKQFLQEFVSQFHIGTGHDDVRVALIPYAWGVYTRYAFNLDTYKTKDQVLAALGRIRHAYGLRTDTGAAIEYMHERQMTPAQTRAWAQKIIIVITDGNSQLPEVTHMAADSALQDGLTIFAIGVGSKVGEVELLNIAGDSSHVARVASYSQLDSIKELLARQACIRKPKPTTTPPPQSAAMCGSLHPADINFVFSPTDLGPDGTMLVTSVFETVVDEYDFGQGFRFGAVTGDCPDEAGIPLKNYTTPESFKDQLPDDAELHLPQLIRDASETAYLPSRGGRDNVRDIAVVAVNGEPGTLKPTYKAIREMKRKGIEVYVLDPYNSGQRFPGTKAIRGKDSSVAIERFVSDLCDWKM